MVDRLGRWRLRSVLGLPERDAGLLWAVPSGLDRLRRLLCEYGILANRTGGFGSDYAACSGHDLGLERGGLDAGADSGKLESYGDVMKLLLLCLRRALAGLRAGVGGPLCYPMFSESHHDRGGHDGRAVKGNREDGLANPRGACSCLRDVPGIGCECLPWESQVSENSPTRWNEADPGSPRQFFEAFPCIGFNLYRIIETLQRYEETLIWPLLLCLKRDISGHKATEQKRRPLPIAIGKLHQQLPPTSALHAHSLAILPARSSKRHGPLVLCPAGGKA